MEPLLQRRNLLIYASIWPLASMKYAQAAIKNIATHHIAAPYITASQMVHSLLAGHFIPGAAALLQAAQALAQSLASGSASASAPTITWQQHRPLWVATMLAWEHLAAVAVGPLLERRSARAIDFWPTRPAQVQALLAQGMGPLTTVAQLDAVGASARGLPALEWLLWKTDGSGHAAAYASLLAQQLVSESLALVAGYEALAGAEHEESTAWELYGEWFGQALGGLDQMRIKKMVPNTRGKDSALWVRGLSGQTAACWQAQARGLQSFLLGSPAAQTATQMQTPGMPVPGSLHSLLLGRGHMAHSKTLIERTAAMLRSVNAAQSGNTASLRRAHQALAQLSAHANVLAGDVLNIALGFTDADGD
jgi:uncharacterized protein